jgi:predicted CXXCH cytochrome family protein
LQESHRDPASSPARRGPIAILASSLLLVGLGLIWTSWKAARSGGDGAVVSDRSAVAWPRSPWENARPGVAYVGDAVCIRCHAEIAETFRRHPMGRSLAPISEVAGAVGGHGPDGSVAFESGGSRFDVERRGGQIVHRETRTDEHGRVLAQVEAAVQYAVGSGTRGVSYLLERDGRLYQSPISWYSQERRWGPSPGYEHENLHFNRPIEPRCLFCHTNQVEPVESSANRYREPIFRGHTIGCERCHGPGELHARRPGAVEGRDPTIVNPRHLEPALRLDVCIQCHVQGAQRVERPGRNLFDYRPGLPTAAFFAIYGHADAGRNNVVGHVEQMKLSRCFRESRGQLDCTSCHDPHQAPAPEEKTEYFRRQCLACHERNGCGLPEPTRRARSRDDDCAQCHMPKSKNPSVAHVATTDHRVLRSPEAVPTEPGPADSQLPLVLLNGDGLGREERASLDRELAIALAAEGPRMPETSQVAWIGSFVMRVLEGVLVDRPEDRAARRMKAMVLALAGHRSDAIRQVEMVLQAAPSDEKALDECLTYAVDSGDVRAAQAHASKAVEVNPWSAVFHERLAYVSVQVKDWDVALRESREALRLDPFLRFARMFLIQVLLHRNDQAAAREELARLIGLNSGLREPLERWFADQCRLTGQ